MSTCLPGPSSPRKRPSRGGAVEGYVGGRPNGPRRARRTRAGEAERCSPSSEASGADLVTNSNLPVYAAGRAASSAWRESIGIEPTHRPSRTDATVLKAGARPTHPTAPKRLVRPRGGWDPPWDPRTRPECVPRPLCGAKSTSPSPTDEKQGTVGRIVAGGIHARESGPRGGDALAGTMRRKAASGPRHSRPNRRPALPRDMGKFKKPRQRTRMVGVGGFGPPTYSSQS